MSDGNIKAVIFDLDGVICFSDRYHYLAWKKLADENGWSFDEKMNHLLRGVPRLASLEIILKNNNVELSQEKKEALAKRKNEEYKKLLEQINENDLYPGVVPFITRLRERNIKIGLASSSKNAAFALDRLNITRLFDAIVTGNDIKKAKPNPEIFLTAAERLSMEPANCVVFEDAESGVEGAIRAGMKAVGVGTPETLPNASEHMTSYENDINLDALLKNTSPVNC